MATTTATSSYLRRLIGSAALDLDIYEEIEADRSAGGQAFLTVLLSSIAAGIGAKGFGGYTLSNPRRARIPASFSVRSDLRPVLA